MQLQFGQRLATVEFEIAEDEIALDRLGVIRRARRVLRLSEGGHCEQEQQWQDRSSIHRSFPFNLNGLLRPAGRRRPTAVTSPLSIQAVGFDDYFDLNCFSITRELAQIYHRIERAGNQSAETPATATTATATAATETSLRRPLLPLLRLLPLLPLLPLTGLRLAGLS